MTTNAIRSITDEDACISAHETAQYIAANIEALDDCLSNRFAFGSPVMMGVESAMEEIGDLRDLTYHLVAERYGWPEKEDLTNRRFDEPGAGGPGLHENQYRALAFELEWNLEGLDALNEALAKVTGKGSDHLLVCARVIHHLEALYDLLKADYTATHGAHPDH